MGIAWALRCWDLGYTFRDGAACAVDGVSLQLKGGEGLGLFGPNGAGKSTLMRLIAGQLKPDRGCVEVAGRDASGLPPEGLADRIGFGFQEPDQQLFTGKVRDELAFGPRQLGWSEARIRSAVEAVLDELELAPVAGAHPYDLPAPQRRLVTLGTALVSGPSLIILDEPTAALDRFSRRVVERVLRSRRRDGAAVLSVTHDLAFAAEALERACVMVKGRIVSDGPVDGVLGGLPEAQLLPAPLFDLTRRVGLRPANAGLEAVAAALAERCRPTG